MKEKFKKLFNNRIFRTFIETFFSTILVYFGSVTILDIDLNAIICVLISALATGLSAILPLFNEDNNNSKRGEENE